MFAEVVGFESKMGMPVEEEEMEEERGFLIGGGSSSLYGFKLVIFIQMVCYSSWGIEGFEVGERCRKHRGIGIEFPQINTTPSRQLFSKDGTSSFGQREVVFPIERAIFYLHKSRLLSSMNKKSFCIFLVGTSRVCKVLRSSHKNMERKSCPIL